ncbi:MAG: hypothetical protein QM820_07955 [Minicystis sp.]
MRKAAAFLMVGVLGTSVTASGCAEFNKYLQSETPKKGKHTPPAVKVSKIKLIHAPNEKQLGIHYCMQLAKAELGELGELGCELFGKPPSRKDLQFVFDVDIEASNPSTIPLPLAQLMIAFTVFPDRKSAGGRESLGAVCLSMCKDPKNCQQQADACKSTEPEIKDLKSFEYAAANFLISVALGEKNFDDLEDPDHPAGQDDPLRHAARARRRSDDEGARHGGQGRVRGREAQEDAAPHHPLPDRGRRLGDHRELRPRRRQRACVQGAVGSREFVMGAG